MPSSWKIFDRTRTAPHSGLAHLPLPPWRNRARTSPITKPDLDKDLLSKEASKSAAFLPDEKMEIAVNAALYLRRPLLLTGKPGTGKSTLIYKVANQLKLGPVLRWNVSSRSSVREGLYTYDAVARMQMSRGAKEPPINQYLTLGPLGTALLGESWPRALLIDEIDKGDLDLANDLLNVIEEGVAEIPELRRLGKRSIGIEDGFGRKVQIPGGVIECRQFPFVVMTSNAEREFPPAFLRRCIRLTIDLPSDPAALATIVHSHLDRQFSTLDKAKVLQMASDFLTTAKTKELATDQLLNAVFLTLGMNDGTQRSFTPEELKSLQEMLLEALA
jgi:MoxR-like ATPase